MSLPIAINGVGRIGRSLIRLLDEHPDLDLRAVNDTAPASRLVHLLKRDTFLGRFPGGVELDGDRLVVGDRRIAVHAESDPASIPWAESGVRLVLEATGALTEGNARAHLGDGVERVIVSANADEADATVCFGVNQDDLTTDHRLVSASSCTTNCLAVAAKVLDETFGIEHALLNTVHCFNNNQPLVDADHLDPRRARAATVNMIPTTTGASSAIGRVLPELATHLDGFAVRVPAAQVSMIDLVFVPRQAASVSDVAAAFSEAAEGALSGVLGVSAGELVSTDFIGDTHSAIVDLPLLQSVDGRLVRVVAWYDNESGYASRLLDLAAWMGGNGLIT